jgi:Sec-independent protein translocase protein TatA
MTAMLTKLEAAAVVGGVIVLFLAARKLGELRRGVRQGVEEFVAEGRRLNAGLLDRRDDLVAEALTPDNRSAEFLAPSIRNA